jgi:hypothetical protein
VDSKLEKVLSEIQRLAVIVEEQNQRSKYVLDGYSSLDLRVSKLENPEV